MQREDEKDAVPYCVIEIWLRCDTKYVPVPNWDKMTGTTTAVSEEQAACLVARLLLAGRRYSKLVQDDKK